MIEPLHVYEFSSPSFVVGSDALVCVAPRSEMVRYMTLEEVSEAFSGYASYRQAPWMKQYVGVWGKKNCQRFRRFLRERGADVLLKREAPPRLRLTFWATRNERRKVRLLSQLWNKA